MINGLWTVAFSSDVDLGTGVVVITNGRLLGGDSWFTYNGSIVETNGYLSVRIKVDKFIPNATSVFQGLDNFSLSLAGTKNPQRIEFSGAIDGRPSLTIKAIAIKRADL